MAFIVGILLMKLPEDHAFATLSTIMVEPLYDMRGVYDKSVGKMPFFFFVVDQLIIEYVPEVWEQFQVRTALMDSVMQWSTCVHALLDVGVLIPHFWVISRCRRRASKHQCSQRNGS